MQRNKRWLVWTLAAPLLAIAMGACGAIPVITITSPAHGTFTTAATVNVTGTVGNVNLANTQVRVNGTIVALTGNTWSYTLTVSPTAVLNPVYAEARNLTTGQVIARSRHMVIYGNSVSDGAFSLNGVALRLGDTGLDQLEPIITDGVDLDPATLIPIGTQLIDNYCIGTLFGGCVGRVDVFVDTPAPSFTGFAIDTDSMTNFVAGDIDISNLQVNVFIDGVSGIAPDCDLRLTAANTQILGDYALSPDPIDPSKVDVNQNPGSLSVSFSNFNQQFTSGICDFPLIGDLIQAIIGDVEPLVRDGFEDFLQDPDGAGPADAPVAEAIEVALADISISGPIGEALQVNFESPLFAVTEDNDGITLGSDARITSSIGTGPGQCTPPFGTPNLNASYHVSEAFPAFGATSPGGFPYHLAVAISTSAFNQLLKAQTECGLLRTSLTEADLGAGLQPITAGTLLLFLPTLSGFDPATPMRIDLKPTLAPFMTGATGPAGELGELRLAQLEIEVHIDDGLHPGNSGLIIKGTIDAKVGLDLAFDPLTSSLTFTIGAVSDIQIAFLRNNVTANEANVITVLNFILPDLLPALGDGLGAFPLPQFFGLSLAGVEVTRTGQFYSLYADLVP
jgi:hypothetical protein